MAKSDFIGRIMLITKKIEERPRGGRELLCKLNHDILLKLFRDQLSLIELPVVSRASFRSTLNAFRGQIDGVNPDSISLILRAIRENEVAQVFVDGSNLGGLVFLIKRKMPEVQVTTFFHNVEARFFLGALIQLKTLRSLAVLIANTLAERKAVKFSDKRICLSERDSGILKALYGRGATNIVPMALEDKYTGQLSTDLCPETQSYALFVGGPFYANLAGITWFVAEVVPYIDMPVLIVGKGFERFRRQLEVPGKVIVVGTVDNIADSYARAKFVIAPIFDGSGMKTKVAEALMFGKKIIGTPEAFSGYSDVASQAGWVCRTPEQFVSAINAASREIIEPFNPMLRDIFLRSYSMDAAMSKFGSILFASGKSL